LPNIVARNIIVFVTMEIMSTPFSLFARICGLSCCVVFTNASGLFAAELVLQKVPPLTVAQAPGYPENLARYHLGAEVEATPQTTSITGLQLSSKSEDTNTAEAALLCDDPTVGYALPSGRTTLLISFPRIENVDSISFLNRGSKGNVNIATSSAKLPADSPQWHDVAQQDLDSDAVKAKIGPSEAKYVRLTFDVAAPGRIAGLGVYSTPAVSDFTMPRVRKVNLQDRSDSFALISYNVTNLHSKSRIIYVSSGDDLNQANNMIDSQPATSFAFTAADGSPTAIVDLGKVTALRRISALYSRRQGTLDFYVLQSLPGSEAAPKNLHIDDNTLAGLKPVGSVADDSSGRAAIDFPVTAGRYIMVKWNPAAHEDTAFSVAEIAAFGGGEPPNLIAANMTSTDRNSEISSEGKDFGDGKDMAEGKDFKDAKDVPSEGPEAPAEGPRTPLPDPPPFNFVPLIVPVSPG
jgi:hypothetical protein